MGDLSHEIRRTWSSWAAQRTENVSIDPRVLSWVALTKVMANQSKKLGS